MNDNIRLFLEALLIAVILSSGVAMVFGILYEHKKKELRERIEAAQLLQRNFEYCQYSRELCLIDYIDKKGITYFIIQYAEPDKARGHVRNPDASVIFATYEPKSRDAGDKYIRSVLGILPHKINRRIETDGEVLKNSTEFQYF